MSHIETVIPTETGVTVEKDWGLVRGLAGGVLLAAPAGLDYDYRIYRDKFAGGGNPGREFRLCGRWLANLVIGTPYTGWHTGVLMPVLSGQNCRNGNRP